MKCNCLNLVSQDLSYSEIQRLSHTHTLKRLLISFFLSDQQTHTLLCPIKAASGSPLNVKISFSQGREGSRQTLPGCGLGSMEPAEWVPRTLWVGVYK